MLKQKEIAEILEDSNALLTGHFLLTSGLHSPNYFQCAKVLQYPKYTSILCIDLARRFKEEVDVVVSPAVGGIVVGQEVGRELNKRTIFTERENEEMTLRRGFEIQPGEKVLIAEDVLTTGRSIREVIKVVEACGAELVGVGVLIDRSGGENMFDCPLESIMKMNVVTYTAEECPLCKEEIPLVKPGSRKKI